MRYLSLSSFLSLSLSHCIRLSHVIFVPASQMSAADVHCLANKAKGPPQTRKNCNNSGNYSYWQKRYYIFSSHI